MALTSEGTIQIWGWNYYYNVTGSGDESENGASGWSREGAGTSGGNPNGGEWNAASAYIPAKSRPYPDAPSGDKTATTIKTLKTTANSVSKIGVGYYTQYVIKSDGSLFAWDRNEWGQSTPRTNSDGTLGLPTGPFTQVAGGYHHSIALRQNGTVACWGENNDGECNVPPNLTDVVWVGASYRMSFALKSDGTLIGWGGLDNFIANPGRGVNPPGIITEIPIIQNYASYNLTNTASLAPSTGCTTRFQVSTYAFPSWDNDIKLVPGISFGKITINDFKYLLGITNPNSGISPC